MSTEPSTTLPAKRKRNEVSRYLDFAALDKILSQEDEDDDLLEGDSVYGSRKKSVKTKSSKKPAKKRAKLAESKPKYPSKPFPFLSLPPELRDYMYELALTESDGLAIVSKTKKFRRTIGRGIIYAGCEGEYRYRYRATRRGMLGPDDKDEAPEPPNKLSPDLLAVNKQIRDEGRGYLYKQPILLEDTLTLHTFLAAIGPENRLQVTNLIVHRWGAGRGTHKAMNVASLTLLGTCTNLKSLNLDCTVGWLRTPKQLARQIYRDGHYFLEQYGDAHGKKDAAVDILTLRDSNYGGHLVKRTPKAEEFKKLYQEELRALLSR